MSTLRTIRPLITDVVALLGMLVLSARGEAQETRFIRGDTDASGRVELTDATSMLSTLYGAARELTCSDAADSNDDGLLDVSDPIHTLLYLFGNGARHPAPGPEECGADPTPDALDCAAFAPCAGAAPGIELDEANLTSAVISPEEGGALSTTASNGLRYTLTFPPGSLEGSRQITLTPVLAMSGLPLDGDVLAAVQLAPSGLELSLPATLTIEGLPAFPSGSVPLGFLAPADGRDYSVLSLEIHGDRTSLSVPHFSLAGVLRTDLVALAEFTLERYYGPGGFLDHLVRAESCGDFHLEQATRIALEFVQVTGDDAVDESGPDFDDLLGFGALDCIYPRNTGDWKCSSFSDFAWAASLSLQNRMGEIFSEKDTLCLGNPRLEEELFSCIVRAQLLGQLGVLAFESYDQILIDEKNCELVTLSIEPELSRLSIGETVELRAVPRDRAGRELTARQVIWRAPTSGVVTLSAHGRRALITARKSGVASVRVEDKLARNFGLAVEGFSHTSAEVWVGGEVEVTPAELTLAPPEIVELSAFLLRADGANITPLSGWSWSSSNPGVAGVLGTSDNRASISARGPGVAIIDAKEATTGLTGSARVTVVASLSVTPSEVCLYVEDTVELSATLLDGEDEALPAPDPLEVVWMSSDSSTVSVNLEGLALAQAPGRVQVTAMYRDMSDTVPVFVPQLPGDVEAYELTPVFAPSDFVRDGVSYFGGRTLTNDREVVNTYEAAFDTASICLSSDAENGEGEGDEPEVEDVQVPRPAAMSNNGLFTYTYEGETHTLYVFDAKTCEEHEIAFPYSAWPVPTVINDRGDIAGYYIAADGESVGFVYNAESDEFEELTLGCGTQLLDMNNHREVIGIAGPCVDADGRRTPGSNFVYVNGEYTTLPFIAGIDFEGDPTSGQSWIRPGAIDDRGTIVGGYRYWDTSSDWWREKGFILHRRLYLLLDPPFPETMPEQRNWSYVDINDKEDILVISTPLEAEDRLDGFLSVMHFCPLE